MIVGTCGFGSSGSSVVTDYLKETDYFNVLDDFEYTINYLPDSILQLDYFINTQPGRNDLSSTAFIRMKQMMKKLSKSSFVKQSGLKRKDFKIICEDFYKEITDVSWRGYNGVEFITKGRFYRFFGISFLMQRFVPFYEKVFHKKWNHAYPYHKIVMCKDGNNFLNAAKKFNSRIIKLLNNGNDKTIALDQPFLGDDPVSCMKYFDDPYAIIVDRNPVDTYIFLKTKLKNRGSFMPSDNVEDFVKYYRNLRKKKLYMSKNSKILFIQFEDMVYKYDETTEKINKFLGIDCNKNSKTIFIPERSMANTQLKYRFPEYQKDVEYIEKELKEFLYDFSKFPKPDTSLKMFFGKSTVNLMEQKNAGKTKK